MTANLLYGLPRKAKKLTDRIGIRVAHAVVIRHLVIRIIGAGYWRKGKAIYERENEVAE